VRWWGPASSSRWTRYPTTSGSGGAVHVRVTRVGSATDVVRPVGAAGLVVSGGAVPSAGATSTWLILVLVPPSGLRVSRPSVTVTVRVAEANRLPELAVGANCAIAPTPSMLSWWTLLK
jgi:hypothetical protein